MHSAFSIENSKCSISPFPGQYIDNNTDLNYNYYRYYMPIIGRYIRKDILKYENNNLYMYCSNNPIKNIDPMGLIDREYFVGKIYAQIPKNKIWAFIGWRVHERDALNKWAMLWVVCKNRCSKEVDQEQVIFQRWRLIPHNVPVIGGDNPYLYSGGGDLVNDFFDLGEAMVEAYKRGDIPKYKIIMRENGQKYCDFYFNASK